MSWRMRSCTCNNDKQEDSRRADAKKVVEIIKEYRKKKANKLKHVDEAKIASLLKIEAGEYEIDSIIEKTKQLKRLTLEESAKLLSGVDEKLLKKIYDAAAYVKNTIYGKRVVMFVPLYISNLCSNNCVYCGFAANNKQTVRKALTPEEIKEQTEILLKRGHKRILMVSGESASKKNIDYYVDAVKLFIQRNIRK